MVFNRITLLLTETDTSHFGKIMFTKCSYFYLSE